MIKHFANGDEKRVVAGSLRAAAEDQENDRAAEHGVDPDFHRMFVKAGQDFQPPRRMMDLMQRAPEELRFMAIAMPPIVNESGEDIGHHRGAPRRQVLCEMKHGTASQPAIPYLGLALQLHDANHATAERLLQKHEIDLAVTELEGKPAPGLDCATLFKLPLILVVPQRMKVKVAADLWRGGKSEEALISLPSDEVMVRQFQTRLKRLGVNWRTRIEVSSIDLILTYVSLGFGVGLSISVPRTQLPRGLRMLPLPGFPPVVVAVLSQKSLSTASATFLEEIKHRARELEQQIL